MDRPVSNDAFLTQMLPQLAAGVPHMAALGLMFDGVNGKAVDLRAPWREDLVGDPETGVLAGGLVTTMLDHVGGLATWTALGRFETIATLDLRVDYMRPARPRADLIARAECYRLTSSIAFVRGWAFEDSIDDPVAASQAAYVLTGGGARMGANLKPRKADGA
jgi:uncharacterized protein (TIGR00369 family)